MFSDIPIAFIERKMAGMDSLLGKIAKGLEQDAKSRASWIDHTGEARRGIRGGVEHRSNDRVLYLAHGTWYARFLELGTEPHDMAPRKRAKKKAMSGPGLEHPVWSVHHPGISARNVLASTFDANVKKIGEKIAEYWSSR